MKAFADLYKRLDTTTSINEKIAALEHYFRTASAHNAAWALYILLEKARKSTITSNQLRKVFLRLGLIPEWLFEESRAHVGDTAETVALLLPATGFKKSDFWDLPLYTWMEDEIPKAKKVSDEKLQELLTTWWSHLPDDEVYVLHKILTGAFRVGVSSGLVLKALATALDTSLASITHRLTGDFTPTPEFFESLSRAENTFAAKQPYPFMLAYGLEEGFEPSGEWQLEWKWDGIRAQVIHRTEAFFIWSRGEDLVTEQFPDLVETLKDLPQGTVLDGELVAWAGEQPHPFALLQTRLGRKKIGAKELGSAPVHLMAYDLLELNGEDIRSHPLSTRRDKLERLLQRVTLERVHMTELLSANSREELEALRLQARERGAEGLMIKRKDSPYLEGRKKGYWWKHKIDPYTLDAVLIYAQAGTGRRSNLFTDYTFGLWENGELVPFAKAYSGLNDSEIAELDRWIRTHTLNKFGPARAVEQEQVFEIAFEGIAASKRHKSGIAVRFPRILRWRKDKPAAEADTLENALRLLS